MDEEKKNQNQKEEEQNEEEVEVEEEEEEVESSEKDDQKLAKDIVEEIINSEAKDLNKEKNDNNDENSKNKEEEENEENVIESKEDKKEEEKKEIEKESNKNDSEQINDNHPEIEGLDEKNNLEEEEIEEEEEKKEIEENEPKEINESDKKENKENINENDIKNIEEKNDNEGEEMDIVEKENNEKNNEEIEKQDSEKIEDKNINQNEISDIMENMENNNLLFNINENLIKIINDDSLNEDELFSNIISEIKIKSKNYDDIGIYIYIHFLLRNSINLFLDKNLNQEKENKQTLSDYLDNKIVFFNFDKFILYLKEGKLLLNNIKKSKNDLNKNGILFEFIKKNIEEADINPEICFEKIEENKYKLLINYDLIKDSMYSKGQHDFFIKLYILYLFTKSNSLLPIVQKFFKLITNKKFSQFNEEKYLSYVDKILAKDNKEEINKIIDNDLIEQIKYFIDSNEKTSLFYLEKFLIQLLGHPDKNIRNKAAKLLNVFYDGHILQFHEPFNPVIKYLNEDFEIEINLDQIENIENYFLFISTPTRIFYVKNENINLSEENNLIFNLGKFKFCGYYDYVLINKDNLKQELETKGRFIVQNSDIKYLNCHSLFVDIHNNSLDNNGKIKKQSSYKDVLNSMNYFSKIGINCLNLIGVLERDVYLNKNEASVSPMAIINRSKICSLLGTEQEFKEIIEEGKNNSIKIIIDMQSSVSSSHYHKKYNNMHLNYIDKFGKLQCLFGTEGDTVKYEDNMILNYRDINAWNLLIKDISELCEKYGISGIHLNNAQTWPQIFSIDLKEMLREQVENEESIRHYSNYEIINGSVVIPNQECGYWDSFSFEINKNEKKENKGIDDDNRNMIENIYPNPLFIKLTKKIWEKYPEFIFIGEFINNTLKYNNREFILGKSGLVPKLNILPEIFTHLYNINTGINNIIPTFQKSSINDIIRQYYNLLSDNLPLNSFFISASGGTIWPYPSLLYGPGCIPYITALFTLNNIPMTYINEIYGKSKRYQICSYYDSIKNEYNKDNKIKKKSHSSSNNYHLNKFKVGDIEKQIVKTKGIKSSIIKEYYEKMRILRQSHKSLLNGKLFFIKNENDKLLSFCREDLENNEIAFIAINFGETESKLDLDFSYLLKKPFFKNLDINTIIKIENWDDSEINYYFTDDIFSRRHNISIMPYESFMIGFSIVKPFEPDLFHKIFSDSLIDLCKKINDNLRNESQKSKEKSKKFISSLGNYSYDLYIISSQLKYLLENNLSLCEFAKWLNTIETILAEYSIKYPDYFNNLLFIQKIPQLSTQYYKYISLLNSLPSNSLEKYPKISLYSDQIQNFNQFGNLCFITPEIGKWTSVGDLGIMIDELTQCLEKIGQDIIVISPYYHYDRNGKSNYLENDPNGFIYINDLEITIDKRYVFKIFFGKKNKIKYYFIYNKEVFPEAYHQGTVFENIIRLGLFAKASLELLCNIQNIPSVIITNDWLTGFVPAYGKNDENYKGVFKYCSFFHIVHNLEEGYQGVIHLPNNAKENYPEILQLKPELIFEKNNNKIINPSQTALLTSDQWGTLSKTYRDDLLNKSNLKDILKEFPNPFAYSNGIFREKRINEIKNLIKDILKNDENNIDLNQINLLNEDYKDICKAQLQQKFFKENFNPKKILFSYLGRITEQKGIKIILDNAEELIKKYNIQIFIAGKANPSEKYALKCMELIENLKKKYPQNFWAQPKEFFDFPILLRYGSDFGLIPSIFEPGGIVQHEYFISGTPIIAHKTGGLKDSIEEYNSSQKTGNGFLFENFENKDFLNAIIRAIKIFGNKNEYKKLCSNAFNSTIGVEDVAQKWGEEFYRIKNKIFYNKKIVEDEIFNFKKNINNEKRKFDEEMELYNDKKYIFGIKEPIEFERTDDDDNEEGYLDVSFIFIVEKGKKYKNVQITGSWDKWNQKFDLSYDPLNNSWKTYIILPRGITYLYKYIVDNEFMINKNEKNEARDNDLFNIIET